MLLATFKHISSKNADYSAAEAYLTFEHDEFTMKPTLDECSCNIEKQKQIRQGQPAPRYSEAWKHGRNVRSFMLLYT